MTHHEFQVEGMSCAHCERAVREALEAVDAGAQVQVAVQQGQVQVDSDQPRAVLAAAIADAGYRVKP